jgi:hypothetical protein
MILDLGCIIMTRGCIVLQVCAIFSLRMDISCLLTESTLILPWSPQISHNQHSGITNKRAFKALLKQWLGLFELGVWLTIPFAKALNFKSLLCLFATSFLYKNLFHALQQKIGKIYATARVRVLKSKKMCFFVFFCVLLARSTIKIHFFLWCQKKIATYSQILPCPRNFYSNNKKIKLLYGKLPMVVSVLLPTELYVCNAGLL